MAVVTGQRLMEAVQRPSGLGMAESRQLFLTVAFGAGIVLMAAEASGVDFRGRRWSAGSLLVRRMTDPAAFSTMTFHAIHPVELRVLPVEKRYHRTFLDVGVVHFLVRLRHQPSLDLQQCRRLPVGSDLGVTEIAVITQAPFLMTSHTMLVIRTFQTDLT